MMNTAHTQWVRPPGRRAAGPAGARWARRIGLGLAVGLAAFLGQPGDARSGPAEDLRQLPPQVREYAIKAGFIYNFARFTEWPAAAFGATSEPLRLCILGENPFGNSLESLSGKRIGDRGVVVTQVLWAEEAPRCHLLFISASAQARLPEIFALLDGQPVLTVGDSPQFLRAGGIIRLEIVDKKVRFRINLEHLQKAGLKLSSRLLQLAILVDQGAATQRPDEARARPAQPAAKASGPSQLAVDPQF